MVISPLEVREAQEDNQPSKIVGYAAKFNQWSSDLGGFIERIAPTAFDKADMSDVRGLIDHDPSRILGRTASGTLRLSVDDIGLRYEIDMPNTSYARDLIESMKRGDINQSSFAFRVNYDNPEAEEWNYNNQTGVYERTINEFSEIFDVSPVTYPAYPSTESVVSQRSLEKVKKKNELEKELEKRALSLQLDLLLLAADDDEDEPDGDKVEPDGDEGQFNNLMMMTD
jgi:HK97 family phage prohead protease